MESAARKKLQMTRILIPIWVLIVLVDIAYYPNWPIAGSEPVIASIFCSVTSNARTSPRARNFWVDRSGSASKVPGERPSGVWNGFYNLTALYRGLHKYGKDTTSFWPIIH